MEPVIYNFRLDVAKSGPQIGITMKLGERNSRKLRITMVNGAALWMPSEGNTVAFKAKKPDGTVILNPCEVVNGIIEYEVTEQTISAAGTIVCEVVCYGSGNEVLYSPGFEIYAENQSFPDSYVESTSEFNTLSDALGRVSAIEENENARQEAEEERQTAFDESIRLANVATERANAAADAYDDLLEGSDWPPHASSHAIGGRDQITPSMIGAQPVGNYLTGESDPTVPSWAKQEKKPSYTAEEVGALDADTYKAADPATVKRAAAAVKLETPRKIGNASFDGTGDITLADIGAAAAPIAAVNVAVETGMWADDTTFAAYPYRAAVPVSGAKEGMYAYVSFDAAESDSGAYAKQTAAYEGGVYIYANALPAATITLLSVLLIPVGGAA